MASIDAPIASALRCSRRLPLGDTAGRPKATSLIPGEPIECRSVHVPGIHHRPARLFFAPLKSQRSPLNDQAASFLCPSALAAYSTATTTPARNRNPYLRRQTLGPAEFPQASSPHLVNSKRKAIPRTTIPPEWRLLRVRHHRSACPPKCRVSSSTARKPAVSRCRRETHRPNFGFGKDVIATVYHQGSPSDPTDQATQVVYSRRPILSPDVKLRPGRFNHRITRLRAHPIPTSETA